MRGEVMSLEQSDQVGEVAGWSSKRRQKHNIVAHPPVVAKVPAATHAALPRRNHHRWR
jgi:hypothetical protein